MPSCHARARPGRARSQRTPKKTSTSQSCSKVSTPQVRHWSSHRSYASGVVGTAYGPSTATGTSRAMIASDDR